MALLHYENLGVHRPDVLLRLALGGLRDFYEFLNCTIKHLESENAVLRLAWVDAPAPEAPEGMRATTNSVWVELREPDDRPNEPERTFDEFLDEDVREIIEVQPRPADPKGAKGGSKRIPLGPEHRLKVLDRDPRTSRLLLDRRPELPELCVRPNTATLRRQREAVWQLQDAPSPSHAPLLRLFEQNHHARWPDVPAVGGAPRWQILVDEQRPGTRAQRAFVEVALRTPDFAILEGPPGSGKTTAICELVLQLVEQGKRVLLCASTHVAVDNVLERLGPISLRDDSDLVPVRVGDRRKVSEKARPFQLDEIVRTERDRIVRFLRGKSPRTAPQEELLRTTSRDPPGTITSMILDAANLVCGTTTGILQHPDIRRADATSRAGMFDVLIVDEASKTTFQEFLVPALLARRWIIVGDPRQLSPFIEEAAVAANLVAAVPDEATRDACVDVFLAGHDDDRRRRSAVVGTDDPGLVSRYGLQASARGVSVQAPHEPWVGLAQIVVGAPAEIAAVRDRLPADVATLRGVDDEILGRRAAAYRRTIHVEGAETPRWESEVSWRLCRHFELRQSGESTTAARLWTDAEVLLPVGQTGERNGAAERIDRVRRVAFPSVLESLQHGFERRKDQRDGTALSDGLPPPVIASRHVLLEYQHRMAPDISAFPRDNIYGGTALKDPPDMAARRAWSYGAYKRRAIWLHVEGRFERGRNRNLREVDAVMEELEQFRRWAEAHPRSQTEGGSAEPWEVAVLTFYRGQERAFRERLRSYAKAPYAFRTFDLGGRGRARARVELCTVDRFQGHEADIVFLSVANTRVNNFLESANRLNVALTRARYQRVVVGNRSELRKRPGPLLQRLADTEAWETAFGGAR